MADGTAVKRINLALQGGGAHGAFTWGALDRVLEDERIEIVAVTATSAGAMNAAALKSGWTKGGRAGAQASLAKFWNRIAGLESWLGEYVNAWLRAVHPAPELLERLTRADPRTLGTQLVTRVLSPYLFNPGAIHPLRPALDRMMQDGAISAKDGPQLFVAATNVRTGKVRVFAGRDITTDAILASGCVPTLFQAVEIDDPLTGQREAYWDGGYMGNPALFPLFYRSDCRDIVVVHINPIERDDLPYTATEIFDRIHEISFNSSLLRELRMIDFVNRLKEQGLVKEDRLTENRVHSVRDDALMVKLGGASKLTPNRALMEQLRGAGYQAMDSFLDAHFDDIGERSSVDLRAMFGTSSGLSAEEEHERAMSG